MGSVDSSVATVGNRHERQRGEAKAGLDLSATFRL